MKQIVVQVADLVDICFYIGPVRIVAIDATHATISISDIDAKYLHRQKIHFEEA